MQIKGQRAESPVQNVDRDNPLVTNSFLFLSDNSLKPLIVKKHFLVSLFLLISFMRLSASDSLRIEPPFWWEAMEYNTIELMVYAENIQQYTPKTDKAEVLINKVDRPENRNYLFIDLTIGASVSGGFKLIFEGESGQQGLIYNYELKTRREGSAAREGFNSSDVLYLIMPDRFANGDISNDNVPGMLEKADRSHSLGRHGGDLQGVIKNLGYIADNGYTALWLNPVLENDMPAYSYHGYAITDFYQVDARFGGNEAYLQLSEECSKKNIKLVMDMVFNHAGTETWWVKDLPMADFINQWPEYTRSNYHGEVNNDVYASDFDKNKMERGWFDRTMADLNQRNPHMFKYLLQNSIWWIEYANLGGIRMDTHPYPEKQAMSEWARIIQDLYPNFSIVGETWLNFPVHTAYWQKDAVTPDGYNGHLKSVTDFPVNYAAIKAFNETDGWQEGLSNLYFTLTQDYLYPAPQNLLIFPDNHDVERITTSIDADWNKYRQIMAFYATTRGIPQIYYGTEIMMDARPYKDHGSYRRDFPGGWDGDKKNAFTGQGLTAQELEAQAYMKKLLNWRKDAEVIHTGKYKHFIPEDLTYVYTRYSESEAVVVILNKNKEPYSLKLDRYREILEGYTKAVDILSGREIQLNDSILLDPLTPLILELKKN